LTPTSLERAQQQGISIERVLEFLKRETAGPFPRYVEVALTRWAAQGTEARLERVVLLRLSSEEVMSHVSVFPSTRHLIFEQVGPKDALVREKDWPRLVVALGEMGIVPDVVALDDISPIN
jgi:hypothetical protein